MKKMLVLTTGAAMAVVAGTVSAKPLALLGLGYFVVSVWTLTFDETLSSEVFAD